MSKKLSGGRLLQCLVNTPHDGNPGYPLNRRAVAATLVSLLQWLEDHIQGHLRCKKYRHLLIIRLALPQNLDGPFRIDSGRNYETSAPFLDQGSSES